MPHRPHRQFSRTSTTGRIAFGLVMAALLLVVAPTVVRAAVKPSTAPSVRDSPDAAARTKGAYLGAAGAPKVALVGDSLLFGAGWWTTHDLNQSGYQVWTDGDIGKTVADRKPKLLEMLASKPDVLVIELGTNDTGHAAREATPAQRDEALARELDVARTALDAARDVPCVVWVTPSAHVTQAVDAVGGADAHNRLAAKYTAAINDVAPRDHPNVTVADWSTWSASHPAWFDADGIHSNGAEAGQRGMADLITQTVRHCRTV